MALLIYTKNSKKLLQRNRKGRKGRRQRNKGFKSAPPRKDECVPGK